MQRIREGDQVNVFWTNEENLIEAVVLHVPSDVEDMWQFRSKDGEVFAVYPSCPTLDIHLQAKGDESEREDEK